MLSQTVGTLPWGIFERKSGGSKARRDQYPLAFVFADPNPETTTGGGELGPITSLWRLDPCRMLVERLSDGSRRYTYTEENGQPRTLLDDEVWHLRALPLRDGMRGRSRIWMGR